MNKQIKTKRKFIEEDLIKRDKSVIKLMKMAKESGIIKERRRIIKLFNFELNNRFTSYNTLEKLDKIKKEILKRK